MTSSIRDQPTQRALLVEEGTTFKVTETSPFQSYSINISLSIQRMDLLLSRYYKKPTDISCHSFLEKKQFRSVQIEHKTKLQIAIALTTKYKFFHKYPLIFGMNSKIYLAFQNI